MPTRIKQSDLTDGDSPTRLNDTRSVAEQAPLVRRQPSGWLSCWSFVAFVLTTLTFPKDLALAAISSTFFAFAAFVALIAWRLDQADNKALSYWDVAGALTLIGICAATLMDSDQLVRLVESQHD